jgi:enamine deaminase RidA (YjgF/YER057c/UK114 family)
VKVLQPDGWPRPRGFANGVVAEGRMVFVAGMIGWDETGTFAGDDLPAQVGQALRNVLAVVAEAGGGPEHVVRLTWYVTDRDEYNAAQREIGAAYREVMGRHFPAMAVVEVSGLVEARAKVEIEATAVL